MPRGKAYCESASSETLNRPSPRHEGLASQSLQTKVCRLFAVGVWASSGRRVCATVVQPHHVQGRSWSADAHDLLALCASFGLKASHGGVEIEHCGGVFWPRLRSCCVENARKAVHLASTFAFASTAFASKTAAQAQSPATPCPAQHSQGARHRAHFSGAALSHHWVAQAYIHDFFALHHVCSFFPSPYLD